MNGQSTALLTALVIGLLSRPIVAQRPASDDTGSVIESSGSAELTLQPTRAVITFAVESRAVTAAQAANLNGPKTRKLLAVLTRSRPAPESVLVVAVSVGPNENQQRGTVVDYQARAVLRLVVTTLDSLGRYLDVALQNGATEVSDVSFTSDSAEAAERKALGLAYAQAYGRAQALAQAAGGSLGPLEHLSNGPEYIGYSRVNRLMQYESSGSVPVTAQGVIVTASVSGAWRFAPQR